jgi:hypothetical protein
MRRTSVSVLVVMLIACASVAQDKWYPSRWGADDQRGAANRVTRRRCLRRRASSRAADVSAGTRL